MVTVPGDTDSAPSIGSKVIRDCAFDGPIWSEKGSLDQGSGAKSDVNCVTSKAYRPLDGVERPL